ncbi:hypothetical protein E6H31_08090 [Candidatus Bathyarchaeota archaeon]|nr:MAG: hypothetical protein E6H31_08090 [Candidatus Bathyarchaeota archaeon]
MPQILQEITVSIFSQSHRPRKLLRKRSSNSEQTKRAREMHRPTILLDEQLFGLDEYLRDLGWVTTKVTPGVTDDEVVSLAKDNKYIVVSLDKKLLSRCRVMGIPSVDLGLEVQAKIVHESLQRIIASQARP